MHLDFSHNHLDTNELKIMAEALVENHSLMGIHLLGNEGNINAFGFLEVFEDTVE